MIEALVAPRHATAARQFRAVIEAPAEAVLQTLRAARDAVSFGWSEPFTTDADGRFCSIHDEGVTRYSVFDALLITSTFESHTVAWLELATAADPTHTTTLHDWLARAGRTQREVVALFDRAIWRVKAAARQETNHVA